MGDRREKDPRVWQGLHKFIFLRAFLRGLAFIFLLFIVVAAWLWLIREDASTDQSHQLALRTVLIISEQALPSESHHTPSDHILLEDLPAPVLPDENSAKSQPNEALSTEGISNLYEQTSYGWMPARTLDGNTVFESFRRPFKPNIGNQPIISLALADFGLSQAASEIAVSSLPPDISLALSPYSDTPDYWINYARDKGHEVWITLPMETEAFPQSDTGPHTVLVNAPERENQDKLAWLLTLGRGYIGFISNKDPSFIENATDMRPVIGGIYNRGLGFVNTARSGNSTARSMALGLNAPYAEADLWIDSEPTPAGIKASLGKLERIAYEKGRSVGFFHPYPVSFDLIVEWLQSLNDKGFILAPLSTQTDIQ